MKQIPHNKPCIDSKEREAVSRVLESGWMIMGQEVEKLQDCLKDLVHAKYALAVNSGLSALHLALIALGAGKDDEVIVPSYTCIALLHAINYVGATAVVVDIEKNGFNMNQILAKKKISNRTKAIILPHQFGFAGKMDAIKKFGIPVIEDCALSLGSSYKNRPLGSLGDINIFSFYATKMISTGQGGMIVTNNKKHFQTVDALLHQTKHSKQKNYSLRYNYQLTDIAAAIGNVQLAKLDSFMKRRREIALHYQDALESKKSIEYFPKKGDRQSNYYRFILEFESEKKRNIVSKKLLKAGISTTIPIPNHELLHNLLRLNKKDFPNSEKRSHTTLSIPVFPCLKDREVEKIAHFLDVLLV